MLCENCVHWTVELFTYENLQKRWESIIAMPITPGYKEKFQKESELFQVDFEKTEMLYKYCAQGRIDRFYVMRNPRDSRPKKQIVNCLDYATSIDSRSQFMIPSPIWTLCCSGAHGISEIKGQKFYPGLCENKSYYRVPGHGKIRPEIIKQGECTVCGEQFGRGLRVTEQTYFCCNRHYLEWWSGRNLEQFEKLNKT